MRMNLKKKNENIEEFQYTNGGFVFAVVVYFTKKQKKKNTTTRTTTIIEK